MSAEERGVRRVADLARATSDATEAAARAEVRAWGWALLAANAAILVLVVAVGWWIANGIVGPATGLAYGLFAWLLARVSSTSLALMLYMLPPLGVLASFLVLGEEPAARDLAGGAFQGRH